MTFWRRLTDDLPAVLAGGDAALLAEGVGQVALVVEAATGRDFGNGQVRRLQQLPPLTDRLQSRSVYAIDVCERPLERLMGFLAEERIGKSTLIEKFALDSKARFIKIEGLRPVKRPWSLPIF